MVKDENRIIHLIIHHVMSYIPARMMYEWKMNDEYLYFACVADRIGHAYSVISKKMIFDCV